MRRIAVLSIFFVLFCAVNAHAQTSALSSPFICQWANIQGGCPGNGWEQGFPYPTSPADDNCGPTSVLMVASKWSGTTPVADQITKMDDWLESNFGASWGYLANDGKGSGTEPPELASLARNFFGLTDVTAFSGWTLGQLRQELAQGYPVIVRVRPQMVANYADAHYMVLLGMDSQYVYVNDPGIRNGSQVKYKLQDFIDSWAHTAQWDQNNNEGVLIRAAASNSPYLSFTQGNPGVPGDGVFLTVQYMQPLTLSSPISLSNVTDGFTMAIFSPDVNFAYFNGINYQIQLLLTASASSVCQTTFNIATSAPVGTLSVNGSPGIYTNFPQYVADQSFIGVAESLAPGCTFTLNNISIVGMWVNYVGPTLPPGSLPTLRIDAVSFGLGQDNVP